MLKGIRIGQSSKQIESYFFAWTADFLAPERRYSRWRSLAWDLARVLQPHIVFREGAYYEFDLVPPFVEQCVRAVRGQVFATRTCVEHPLLYTVALRVGWVLRTVIDAWW